MTDELWARIKSELDKEVSEDEANSAAEAYRRRATAMMLMWRWGYDPDRASEFQSSNEPCTRKQARYIQTLSEYNREMAWELENLINIFTGENWNALFACTKGQAMFIIKCFLGEIKPKTWCPPVDWKPWH